MSLLTVVESFCTRTGLSVPSSVIGSTNTQTRQILGLLHELVEEITSDSYTYSALQYQTTFTTVEGHDQGALSTLAPYGFKHIIPDTLWNRTANLQVLGPVSGPEWQNLLAQSYTGTCYRYRVMGGNLHLMPGVSASAAGETIAFEYSSSYAIKDSGGTPKASFTADTDTFVLPEEILLLGLRWKWREEKGLDYGSLRESYNKLLGIHRAKEGTKRVVDMSRTGPQLAAGIVIPFGSINQ